MARRVYFAFHYQQDITRVNVVRNSGMIAGNDQAGFFDASLWEKAQNTSDDALKRMIDNGLKGTSVTVFLLGSETAGRPWVRYELLKSCEIGNGLLAVHIHQIKNFKGFPSFKGANIFDQFQTDTVPGRTTLLSSIYKTYDWISDSGYDNFGKWVEQAAKDAGR